MDHNNSSDCKILHVNTCFLGKYPLAEIPTYTITNAVNFNWQFKILTVMSFNNILKNVLFLSDNELATFLKQTKMK